MQVGEPGNGTGEPFGSPHDPPKRGLAMLRTKKDATKTSVAVHPPLLWVAKPGLAVDAAMSRR